MTPFGSYNTGFYFNSYVEVRGKFKKRLGHSSESVEQEKRRGQRRKPKGTTTVRQVHPDLFR
jgi:hypothetical protein